MAEETKSKAELDNATEVIDTETKSTDKTYDGSKANDSGVEDVVSDGASPDGTAPENDTVDGQDPSDAVPEDNVVAEDVVSDDIVTPSDVAPTPESVVSGDASQDASNSDAVPGGTVPGHIVVDGTELVAGRLASITAKCLLKGERVSIVNCENIMLSGNRANIIKEYRDFLEIASIIHPKHGPFHPRRPDTIITRMIRGMLPRKKPSGRAAHKRLRAYIGVPKQLKSVKKVRFDRARIKKPSANYTTMADLGRTIGWTE